MDTSSRSDATEHLTRRVTELETQVEALKMENDILQHKSKDYTVQKLLHDTTAFCSQTNKATMFTRFSRLPAELRRKIWRSAILNPQVITTRIFRPASDLHGKHDRLIPVGTHAAIRRVSQEARAEAVALQTDISSHPEDDWDSHSPSQGFLEPVRTIPYGLLIITVETCFMNRYIIHPFPFRIGIH